MTKATPILLVLIFSSACTPAPDIDGLKRLCQREARVQIHDQEGWSEFVEAIEADHRQYGGRANDQGTYLVIGPVDGFNFDNEFSRGKDVPASARTRNDYYVSRDGRSVATLVNYTLRWEGFGSGQLTECLNEVPEAYGVAVRDTLK